MGTQRHGRLGIFKGASRTPRKRQASTLSSSLPAGVAYAWDTVSDALTWGPNAPEVLGLSPKDLPRTGRDFAQLVEPGSGLSRLDAIASNEDPRGSYDTRYALRFGPDTVLMVQDAGRWQPDAHGRPALVRGQLRADPASSTGDLLPAIVRARSDLLCCIQNAINEALRVSQTCTLIVGAFEDDEMDSVADIARKLRPMIRRNDHFAALGPARFALTLACCPASEAAGAMGRLAGLLKGHRAAASLRLGAACSPDHTFLATKLLRFAEQASRLTAERGETALLHDFSHARPMPAPDRSAFDLIAALNDRSLFLACQPMVDAQTRIPALVQARPSLVASDGSIVPLGPVAGLEEANLALLADGRMLELAADHLARHPDERLALPVSPRTLQDPEWLPMLAAHLGARPGIESRLIVEIQETALLNERMARGRLDAMKALGIGLALSGFGTGHVSLARLRNLPIDLLKIDGIFIQPLKRSTDDRLYVRTLVDMAQHLGMATAAEWVDDEPTARLLAAWGVDYLQGGLFGEPEAVLQPMSLKEVARKARA